MKKSDEINGIDYLEIIPVEKINDLPLIIIYFFKKIIIENEHLPFTIIIEGGVRKKDINIKWVRRADKIYDEIKSNITGDLTFNEQKAILELPSRDLKKIIVSRPSSDGDFSIYKLKLVQVDKPESSPLGFDPIFSSIDFSFKINCPSEFDCLPKIVCPPVELHEPIIDYMAKDYSSFRRLMLDRLSTIIPGWEGKYPADIGVALVEMLAYVGDHLSYYQDAVATEAYLGTARKHISIKRHARLLDYFIHDGCNARAWVFFQLDENHQRALYGLKVPRGTKLLTGNKDGDTIVKEDDFAESLKGSEVFETMHEITLFSANNEILFYTWGESKLCLPKGATSATIKNDDNKFILFTFKWDAVPGDEAFKLKKFLAKRYCKDWIKKESLEFIKIAEEEIILKDELHILTIKLNDKKDKATKATLKIDDDILDELIIKESNGDIKAFFLSFKVGDVLIFEEKIRVEKDKIKNANPSHRCPVRLTDIQLETCRVNNIKVLNIEWDSNDAIPFPLWIGEVHNPSNSQKEELSIARGNIVLADHGKTVSDELSNSHRTGSFYPRLPKGPLTHAGPYDPSLSASYAYDYDIRDALPEIKLFGEGETWYPKHDLLASDEFSTDFVVEMNDDGIGYIRFGDNIHGRKPQYNVGENTPLFFAEYRIGNGRRGNVGAETITRIVASTKFSGEGITKVWNPLEATGGTGSETNEEIRQYAPYAFRKQERIVTVEDCSTILKRHSEVQKAAAVIQWTGSWYTYFITIDRKGGKEVNDKFKDEIRKFLSRYRLAGHDFEIYGPKYVPLHIKARVCAAPNIFSSELEKALLKVFSNRDLPDGNRGFFHPDNFTLGQSVYLSNLYETAMRVEGVASINFEIFQRWEEKKYDDEPPSPPPPLIEMHFLEVAQLDNDPNFPEYGKIEFIVEGGL